MRHFAEGTTPIFLPSKYTGLPREIIRSESDSKFTGVYTELHGLHFTIHLTKDAVEWISTMESFFKTLLKFSMEAIEELAPLFEAVSIYIQAEAESIKAVSRDVSDGQVKLDGYIPAPAVVPSPDPGFSPPGSWNPPDPVNDIRFWNVNSIIEYRNHWGFTANNSNPNVSPLVQSTFFSTAYDGNSFITTPVDFRSQNGGFPALQGLAQFDGGVDTCAWNLAVGMWFLFKGKNVVATNEAGTNIAWGPTTLDSFPGLAKVRSGAFSQADKEVWANGIDCATIDNNGYYYFTAGNRFVQLDTAGNIYQGPFDLDYCWPALSVDNLNGIGLEDTSLKAFAWSRCGNRVKHFFIYEKTLLTWFQNDPNHMWYGYVACQSDTTHWDYSWNAMHNYLNGPWPWPSCG